jgi:TrmH family RNA methyltransferase
MITSSQNAKVKLARSLAARAKDRRTSRAFLAEGVRLVEEALTAHWPFRYLLYSDDVSERGRRLLRDVQECEIETEEVQSRLLETISDTATSQGVLAVLEDKRLPIPRTPDFVLILDAVREPGNAGTLLRSASAAGVQAVFVAPGSADPISAKVVRAGMGAHFRLPIHSLEWDAIGRHIESAGLTVCLADMHGRACWEAPMDAAIALIIGGEAEGASPAARRLTHETISVPMESGVESLNAAVAGSILMFEALRQRRLSA